MCAQILHESALAGRSPGPAAPLLTGSSALRVVLDTVAAWIIRSGQRKALRELAREGRLLADIGVTPEQALREVAKRFWQP